LEDWRGKTYKISGQVLKTVEYKADKTRMAKAEGKETE